MDKILLVSLISDQTIPNIQMIKEVKSKYINCDYLIITTEKMNKKGIINNVIKAAKLDISSVKSRDVQEYSFEDIQNEIKDFEYNSYDKIFVNLTGGTKIMTLAVFDYFKANNKAIIMYIPDSSCYIKLYPELCKHNFVENITLREYLEGYGFSITETPSSGIPFELTEILFNKYCSEGFDRYSNELSLLRENRQRGIKDKEKFNQVSEFLDNISFVPKEPEKLSDLEVKYLTGEWFEEYIGHKIKSDLNIKDSDILVGAKIFKEMRTNDLNSVQSLLNIEKKTTESGNENEIDVMFIYNNSFYVIECKTSIINLVTKRTPKKNKKTGEVLKNENGEVQYNEKIKSENILGDTIYKSDALKTKFGLFAKSYIFTLTDFVEYSEKDKNNIKQMETLIDRASISGIKLVDKKMILGSNNFQNILK